MGLELFSPDDDSAAVVTAVRAPDGIDSDELLLHLRDRHGVTLAPGQGQLKGAVFRIGHIGWFDVFDIATALCRGRAVAQRARRRHRTRRRSAEGVRSVRVLRCRLGFSSASRSRTPESSCCARKFDVDVDTEAPLASIIGDYDALIVRSATKVDAELIGIAHAS